LLGILLVVLTFVGIFGFLLVLIFEVENSTLVNELSDDDDESESELDDDDDDDGEEEDDEEEVDEEDDVLEEEDEDLLLVFFFWYCIFEEELLDFGIGLDFSVELVFFDLVVMNGSVELFLGEIRLRFDDLPLFSVDLWGFFVVLLFEAGDGGGLLDGYLEIFLGEGLFETLLAGLILGGLCEEILLFAIFEFTLLVRLVGVGSC
jgi:hypothetical protein